jgi:putative ABC transport system ATP-binding protein
VTEVVTLTGITRRFDGSPPVDVIRECDVTVQEGDFMTIEGPSGSGKSTLLNIIGLLDRPSSGRYRLAGDDVGEMDDRRRTAARGQQIGFVFQSFQLLERRSCVDNVALATLYRGMPMKPAQEAAMSALAAVGLLDKADQTPIHLSGGERQRVAIARAIVGRPALLLCDEPTGNLDSRNAESILELFAELNRAGTTILLITHDARTAALGNRRLTILDGVVSERVAR